MSKRTKRIWANNFVHFVQILQVRYHWLKKGIDQRDISRNQRSPPYLHAPPTWPKNHPILGLKNGCYHSAQEWNTNETSSLQHLLSLVLFAQPERENRSCSWLSFDGESCSNLSSKRMKRLSFDMNVASCSLCLFVVPERVCVTTGEPIEWRLELKCAVY